MLLVDRKVFVSNKYSFQANENVDSLSNLKGELPKYKNQRKKKAKDTVQDKNGSCTQCPKQKGFIIVHT